MIMPLPPKIQVLISGICEYYLLWQKRILQMWLRILRCKITLDYPGGPEMQSQVSLQERGRRFDTRGREGNVTMEEESGVRWPQISSHQKTKRRDRPLELPEGMQLCRQLGFSLDGILSVESGFGEENTFGTKLITLKRHREMGVYVYNIYYVLSSFKRITFAFSQNRTLVQSESIIL